MRRGGSGGGGIGVEAEEETHQEGGEDVDQVEKDTQGEVGKQSQSHHAENKGGTGVVAKRQKALGLAPGALPAAIEGDGSTRPHRVAADESQRQRRRAGSADTK